jgi:GNAT superfamily N-acetyltransferase
MGESTWTVEPAGPDDIPALAELMAGAPLLRRYGTTRESARVALVRAQRKDDLLLLARAPDGRRLGLAWVIGSRMLTRAAYLRLLLVSEALHGQGLGSELLDAAEARAREWANHMFLMVTADNLDARRFYAERGYRQVGELPEHAAPRIDEVLYHKALRPHGDRLPA